MGFSTSENLTQYRPALIMFYQTKYTCCYRQPVTKAVKKKLKLSQQTMKYLNALAQNRRFLSAKLYLSQTAIKKCFTLY